MSKKSKERLRVPAAADHATFPSTFFDIHLYNQSFIISIPGVIRFVQVDSETCVIDGTLDGLSPGAEHGVAIHASGISGREMDTVLNGLNDSFREISRL